MVSVTAILNLREKMEIAKDYLSRFEIKKPRKDENRQRLIQELSEVTGWSKKAIYFSTNIFPESWLEDALRECRHYSNPKLRNMKFKEFIAKTKQL